MLRESIFEDTLSPVGAAGGTLPTAQATLAS